MNCKQVANETADLEKSDVRLAGCEVSTEMQTNSLISETKDTLGNVALSSEEGFQQQKQPKNE